MNKFEIKERLTDKKLSIEATKLEQKYKGLYEHENREYYELIEIGTLNMNSKGYWTAIYILCDKEGDRIGRTTHTMLLEDFLDGRFQQIVIEKEHKYEVEVFPQYFIFDTHEEAVEFTNELVTSKGNIEYDINITYDF